MQTQLLTCLNRHSTPRFQHFIRDRREHDVCNRREVTTHQEMMPAELMQILPFEVSISSLFGI
jgi:hypothetical protein